MTENTYTEQNGNFGVKYQNKQLVREDDNLFDPSELFDFLSSDECREESDMNDVDYLNNLDFDFNLKGLCLIMIIVEVSNLTILQNCQFLS